MQIEHMLWYRKRNVVTKDVANVLFKCQQPKSVFYSQKVQIQLMLVYDINVLTDKKN